MSNRARGVVYSAIVFFAGLLLGLTVMRLHEGWETEHTAGSLGISRGQLEHIRKHPDAHAVIARTPERHAVEGFRAELNLTAAQNRRLEAILDEKVRQHQELNLFFRDVNHEGLSQIRAMLDQDQQRRFDAMVKKK